MKKILAGVFALVCAFVAMNGRMDFHWDHIALASTPTPVPSCQFAGYDQNGSLVNTTIVCVSPVPSGTGLVTTVGATATACGAPVTPGPAGGAVVIQVPVCATASAGPALPLSIANGGTGTAAPAPTGTNGCTVGTFPSLLVSCPGNAQATPSPTASGGILISGSYPYTIFASPAVPQLTPSPTASGGINISGAYPYTIFASPAVPQLTPSPTATSTSTAGAPSCVYSGSFPYTQTCNFPVAVAQNTASPTATATSTAGVPSFTVSGSFPYTYTIDFPVAGATQAPGFCNATQQCFIKSGTQTWFNYVNSLNVANLH